MEHLSVDSKARTQAGVTNSYENAIDRSTVVGWYSSRISAVPSVVSLYSPVLPVFLPVFLVFLLMI